MPGIIRKDDTAGGAITNTQTKVKANSKFVIVFGDPVASHGGGPHASATMNEKSSKVKAGGSFVCRVGDKATCNDPAVNVGSCTVNAG